MQPIEFTVQPSEAGCFLTIGLGGWGLGAGRLRVERLHLNSFTYSSESDASDEIGSANVRSGGP